MKFWWSLTWRTWVLMLPVMIAMDLLLWWLMPELPQAGTDMGPEQMIEMMRSMVPVYLLAAIPTLAAMVYAMVYAVRWTLGTRWKDFRIKLVAPEIEAANR